MLLNIGFGNVVARDKVVAIINSDSAPMRRYREEAGQISGEKIIPGMPMKVEIGVGPDWSAKP